MPPLVLLALLAATLSAQPEYVTRVWRTQEGLPENRVRALAQTPDGYLWIGTSGGLARFDGVRFVVYTRINTAAITEDNIRSLAVAADGSLWAATDGGGLLHLKDGEFKSFGPKDGLASDFVGSVLADRTGAVWAATNRGLFRRGADKFVRVDQPSRFPNQAYFTLGESHKGEVLAGGQAGLFRAAPGKPEITPASPEAEEVFRLRHVRNGAVWLSHYCTFLSRTGFASGYHGHAVLTIRYNESAWPRHRPRDRTDDCRRPWWQHRCPQQPRGGCHIHFHIASL